MSTMAQHISRFRPRNIAAVLLTATVVLPLAACDTYTSNCSLEMGAVECTVEISGSGRHDLPYPVDAAEGSEKPPRQ